MTGIALDVSGIAEIRTVTTLRSKRDEITRSVEKYERLLGQARADLSHIEAAISIFEASGDPKGLPAYVDVRHLFKRGEQTRLFMAALVVLAKSIGSRIIHALGMLRRQGRILAKGRIKAAMVWELPPQQTLV